MKKIVPPIRGFAVKDFNWTVNKSGAFVTLIYAKKGRFGKLLKFTFQKRVYNPKGFEITKIQNNEPRVGFVTLTYRKSED